jgi:hypothetical protein
MIDIIQWPPIHYCTYSLLGRRFEQGPDEPFVTRMLDGEVDTDLKRQTPGWINRIQRFGIQNNIPKTEWDEQTVLYSLLPKIPAELRKKYFRESPSSFQHQVHQTIMSNPHTAPVPLGLAEAAGFPGVADDDVDLPRKLATLSPDKWLAVLKKWVAADPVTRKSKTVAGPAFWYALHTVALNPTNTTTPNRFVGVWLGSFPCRTCRIGGRVYIARHPVPGWQNFAQWASSIHDYVTFKR